MWGRVEEPGSGYEEVRSRAFRRQRRGPLAVKEGSRSTEAEEEKETTHPARGRQQLSLPQRSGCVRRAPAAYSAAGRGGTHATANGSGPCAIASPHASQPETSPDCTCPGVKGARGYRMLVVWWTAAEETHWRHG